MASTGIRHLARQRALQFLYALQCSDGSFEETETDFLGGNPRMRKGWSDFAHELALRTSAGGAALDAEIGEALERWTIDRLAVTDRLCLQLALTEFRQFADIPLRVTINEYIDLARRFGDDKSAAYVNGVLDKLAQKYRHKDFIVGEKKVAPAEASPAEDVPKG